MEFLSSGLAKYVGGGLIVILGLWLAYRLIKRAGRKEAIKDVALQTTRTELEHATSRLEVEAEVARKSPGTLQSDLGMSGTGRRGGLRRDDPG